MPFAGNLKANTLVLQGHGAFENDDVVLKVEDSTFTVAMGSNLLFTVAPDGVSDINNSSEYAPSQLTFNRNIVVEGNLGVEGTINANIINSATTAALSNIISLKEPLHAEYAYHTCTPLFNTTQNEYQASTIPRKRIYLGASDQVDEDGEQLATTEYTDKNAHGGRNCCVWTKRSLSAVRSINNVMGFLGIAQSKS